MPRRARLLLRSTVCLGMGLLLDGVLAAQESPARPPSIFGSDPPPRSAAPKTPQEPKKDTPRTAPPAPSAEKPDSAEWGAGEAAEGEPIEDFVIPIEWHSAVTFGPPGCPVVVVEGNVYSARTGALKRKLSLDYNQNHLTALSADGKLFAVAGRSQNQEGTPVTVYAIESGEPVMTIPGDDDRYVDVLLFSLNRYVVVGGRSTNDLQVWDTQNRRMTKAIPMPGKVEGGNVAFTSDGKYYTSVVRGELLVHQTSTGKPVVLLTPPGKMERNPTPPPAEAAPARSRTPALRRPAATRPDTSDAVFVYAWLQTMKFSPDNQELAAISTHPVPRLIADAIAQRLAKDGIHVDLEGSTVLSVKFSEAAGDTLPIYERQSRFDFRGRDTGRKATERNGTLVLELWTASETKPLWRDTITSRSDRSFREDINDATIRQSMLEHLTRSINRLNIPYFIPKSDDMIALPVVIE